MQKKYIYVFDYKKRTSNLKENLGIKNKIKKEI